MKATQKREYRAPKIIYNLEGSVVFSPRIGAKYQVLQEGKLTKGTYFIVTNVIRTAESKTQARGWSYECQTLYDNAVKFEVKEEFIINALVNLKIKEIKR